MDYLTSPLSRKEIRAIAKAIRVLFKCKNKYRFDAVDAFEKLPKMFPNVCCEVIEDDDFSEVAKDVPSACIPGFDGSYRILVREKVYDGAARGVGGYRTHIVHEISHYFLCELGHKPILNRSFGNGEIRPCYRSMEWQAKSLAGEITVPYEETKELSISQIMTYCQVSLDSAERRKKIDQYRKKTNK